MKEQGRSPRTGRTFLPEASSAVIFVSKSLNMVQDEYSEELITGRNAAFDLLSHIVVIVILKNVLRLNDAPCGEERD